MKSIYILITLFIIALSTLAGACQRHKNTGVTSPDEQAEIKMLKQEIHDSIRTFNVNFAKEAILKGKNVAKDSDDYTKNYYGVIYQINAQYEFDGFIYSIDRSGGCSTDYIFLHETVYGKHAAFITDRGSAD